MVYLNMKNHASATFDSAASPVRVDELKVAMRQLAAGVCVVTAGTGADRTGATVTSATTLSLEPPTIIVNINLNASVWATIKLHQHFCVNILSSQQQTIASRFAGMGGEKGIARYADAEWYRLESGALALSGALASIDCEVEEIIQRHTHAIVIGHALKITASKGSPLIYHDGNYHSLKMD
ncbi:flavin reductase family protein [Paraburkholderia aspalathi]|nr:flavin reductase family protein [Paraburkholderia aspalathi]